MRHSTIHFFGQMLLFCTSACKPARTDVQSYGEDDPVLAAACREARSRVQTFLDALKSPKADYRYLVKVRVQADGHVEHMWLEPVSFDGTLLSGPIANEPLKITSIKMGSTAKEKPEEISDWVILDAAGEISSGGFTQKAMEAHKGKSPD